MQIAPMQFAQHLERGWSRLRGPLDKYLFRAARLEAGPIVLGQRRIFVLPTRAGWGFALAMVVMLIASINYHLSLGYIMVFSLGGIAFVSIVHAFRNLLRLSLTPARVEPVFAGDTAHFPLIFSNREARRRPALLLNCPLTAQQRPPSARPSAQTRFSLAPDSETRITLDLPTHQRGWMHAGRVTLETTYPLDLIRAWSVFRPDMRALVYPRPESAPPPLPLHGQLDNGTLSERDGDDDFAGLRPHDPAHSPRHIAWKVVARGGPMLTKHFTGSGAGAVCIDWQATPASMDQEARLSRMTAWVLAADADGLAFSLILPGLQLPIDSGLHHTHNALRALALFGIRDETSA